MLRDVEIVAIWIRPACLRVGPSVWARFWQFIWIDLLHLLYNGLAVFDLEAEVVQPIGRVLIFIGDDGQIKITVSEENGSSFLFYSCGSPSYQRRPYKTTLTFPCLPCEYLDAEVSP
jgi:hypothetical protein